MKMRKNSKAMGIRKLLKKGYTPAQIKEHMDVSDSYIHAIKTRLAAEERAEEAMRPVKETILNVSSDFLESLSRGKGKPKPEPKPEPEVEAAATTIRPSYDPEAGEYVVVEGAKSAQEVDAILNTRASNYGSFLGLSQVTQRLKAVAHQFAGQNNKTFDADQAEALDLIFTKIGRILNGDPNYVDSWTDIAGYATLVADRLQGKIR
jgi:hypothetical protein